MFTIKKINYDYFAIELTGMPFTLDLQISEVLKIDVKQYRLYLTTFFNARISENINEVYFKKLKDAKRALEWIEGIYTATILVS